MNLHELTKNLERRCHERNLKYNLGIPAGESEILVVEKQLGLSLPLQVRAFYMHCNGLTISELALEIFPVQRFELDSQSRIIFAVVENSVRIAFDASTTNAAGQWNIVEFESSYVITLTLASFWSNKIWKWIDSRQAFWAPCN